MHSQKPPETSAKCWTRAANKQHDLYIDSLRVRAEEAKGLGQGQAIGSVCLAAQQQCQHVSMTLEGVGRRTAPVQNEGVIGSHHRMVARQHPLQGLAL